VDEQEAAIQRMMQHMEAHSGFQSDDGSETPQMKADRLKLADLKAELTRKKSIIQSIRRSQARDPRGMLSWDFVASSSMSNAGFHQSRLPL
jgi:hypothetical protein